MLYKPFKTIHLLGVAPFLETSSSQASGWRWLTALKSRKSSPVVTLTDWILTAGGVVLILLGAYGMAYAAGLDLRQGWVLWGQVLFAVPGLIWIPNRAVPPSPRLLIR